MSTIKEIYDLIRELREFAKKNKDEKVSEKIVEIQDKIFELRDELDSLRDQNEQLKQRIKELQDVSAVEADLELTDKGAYVRKSEVSQQKNIMYCAACWQNYKKLMPYVRTIGAGKQQCSNCHGLIQIGV